MSSMLGPLHPFLPFISVCLYTKGGDGLGLFPQVGKAPTSIIPTVSGTLKLDQFTLILAQIYNIGCVMLFSS